MTSRFNSDPPLKESVAFVLPDGRRIDIKNYQPNFEHKTQGGDTPRSQDAVNNPTHYNRSASGVECITVAEHFNFCLGNALKYIWRADHKGGTEDLRKARWYLDREISRRESQPSTS